jgi:phosphate transport system permease protein
VLFALLQLAGWTISAGTENTAVPLLAVSARSGIAVVVLFIPLFVGRLVWLSRTLADRVFAGTGLAATLAGLLVLALFLGSLALQTWQWFRVTPRLVQADNERFAAVLRDSRAEENANRELALLRQEMEKRIQSAATAAEREQIRKHYEETLIPRLRTDLGRTAEEKRTAAAKSIRSDTSPPALLWHFLTAGPSNVPQDAGVYPALLGSLWVALITAFFALPIGVGAALYLEEYRARSWLGSLIQANINNLASVPSVVYGILGAFLFVELIFKPLEQHLIPAVAARNVLGGGLTLGLLTLPAIIVAAQEAIRAVPQSVRDGAYALGATRWQVIRHSVLPLARPGILTGTILSISRAIGEAAPLVLFGTLLFVNREPSLFSRFTVVPMQIFGWTDRPPVWVDDEPVGLWQYNAALASILLFLLLLSLDAMALLLRHRAQKPPNR